MNQSHSNPAVIHYADPSTAAPADELIEGETRLGLTIQLSLIAVLIAAMAAIVLGNRFLL